MNPFRCFPSAAALAALIFAAPMAAQTAGSVGGQEASAQDPTGPEELNRGLVTAARFLNMHAQAGIDPALLRVALVAHGSAAKDLTAHLILQEEGYRINPF